MRCAKKRVMMDDGAIARNVILLFSVIALIICIWLLLQSLENRESITNIITAKVEWFQKSAIKTINKLF